MVDEEDTESLRKHISQTVENILYKKKAEGQFIPTITSSIRESVERVLAPYLPEFEVKAIPDPLDPTKLDIKVYQKMIKIQVEIPKEDM